MLSPSLPPLFWELIPYEGQDFFPARPYNGCVGYFWDSVNKKRITIRMGYVNARPVFAFRSASSVVKNQPFVGSEVAVQNAQSPSDLLGHLGQKASCSVSTTATKRHICRGPV